MGLWLKRVTSSSVRTDAGVRVFVNATPDTVGATLLFFAPQHIAAAPSVSKAGWYYFEGLIPDAGDQYVIIQGVDQGISDIWIDELAVQTVPNCFHPTDMAWDEEAQEVTWEAGTASQWQVREGDSLTVVDAPEYTNRDWESNTIHTVSVRSICGDGDTNDWQAPFTFRTPRMFVDTVFVAERDTVTLRDTLTLHDTVFVPSHDTVFVPQADTVVVTVRDTLYIVQYDTIMVPVHDTVFDTVYVQVSVGESPDGVPVRIFTEGSSIVVEGAGLGEAVKMYDIHGRLLAAATIVADRYTYNVPASGTYMVCIGDRPARKLVVAR